MKSKLLRFSCWALLSLGLDVTTKIWARTALRHDADITVIPGFFDLQFSLNSGSAFSLLRGTAGARYVLLGFGLVALVLIFAFLRRADPAQRRFITALGLLCGGAIGNLADRAVFGQVTDFIRLHYHGLAWPTFNVADSALVVGAGLLLLDVLRSPKGDEGKGAGNDTSARTSPTRPRARKGMSR